MLGDLHVNLMLLTIYEIGTVLIQQKEEHKPSRKSNYSVITRLYVLELEIKPAVNPTQVIPKRLNRKKKAFPLGFH